MALALVPVAWTRVRRWWLAKNAEKDPPEELPADDGDDGLTHDPMRNSVLDSATTSSAVDMLQPGPIKLKMLDGRIVAGRIEWAGNAWVVTTDAANAEPDEDGAPVSTRP